MDHFQQLREHKELIKAREAARVDWRAELTESDCASCGGGGYQDGGEVSPETGGEASAETKKKKKKGQDHPYVEVMPAAKKTPGLKEATQDNAKKDPKNWSASGIYTGPAGRKALKLDPEKKLRKESADLDQMKKDADANQKRAAKLKDRDVTRASASFAGAKVADTVKKANKYGPQQHKGTKTGAMRIEELSIDDQMRISREAAKNRNPKPDHKAIRAKQLKNSKAPKDTRTDAEKMTDATGPRKGSNYRGD